VPFPSIISGSRHAVQLSAGLVVACLLLMFNVQSHASDIRTLDLQQLTDEISLSSYVVQVQPGSGEDSLSEIMALPDSLLYTAKRNGRNQVAFLRNSGS